MKVAIYSRKSVYSKTGDSIENQIDLCKDYYTRMSGGSEFEFEVYEDDGFSGKNIQRPQFQKLLNDIKAKKIKALICYRLDRISRNVADFSSTLDLLQKYNVDFISIREQFDTSTPMGRAMIHIASVFAQLERETIAERVRDNMIELAKTGRWLGGTPPLGFDSIRETYLTDDLKEKSLSRLIVTDDETKTVKLLFSKYLELRSLNLVSRFAYENNITGKNGGELERSGLSQLFQNPAYVKSTPEVLSYLKSIGYSTYGEANGNGLLRYSQDTNDKIATVSNHKGIIDAEDWLKVQEILTSNFSPLFNNNPSHTAVLSSILKCSKCGASMIVKYGSKYKTDKKAFYYVCATKAKRGVKHCSCKNIKGSLTEELVLDQINSYNKNDLLAKLLELSKKHKNHISDNSKELEQNIAAIDTKIKRLLQKLSLTDDIEISKMILNQIQDFKKEKQEITVELNNQLNIEVDDSIEHLELDNILTKLNNFKELYENADIEAKRKLLSSIIEKVVWDEDTGLLNIHYNVCKKK